MNDDEMLKIKNTVLKANKSFKWTALAEIMAKLLTPIMNMILARFVAPSIFGIVASLSIVITFAELFSEGGFSRILVQKELKTGETLKKYSGTSNVATIAISLLIFVIIAVFQDGLARLVNCEGYGFFLMMTALQIPLFGFSSVQTAIARRNFDFKWIALVRIISLLVRIGISVAFAATGYGIHALVFGSVISAAIQSILLIIIYRKTLSFRFSFKVFKEIVGLSSLYLLESFVSWLTTSIDTFLIAKFFDQNTNGLYKNAFATASSIVAIATAIYSSIMISLLSRNQEDQETFNKILCKYQQIISYLLIPLGIGILIYRNELTNLFFGSGWSGASLVLGVFALGESVKAAVGLFIMSAFTAKGKPLWNIVANVINLLCVVVVFLGFAKFGFETFTIARSMCFYVTTVSLLILGKVVLKINISKMLRNLIVPSLLSVVMTFVAVFQKSYYERFWYIGIAACVFVYFTLFVFVSKEDFKDSVRMIIGKRMDF